MGKKDSDFLNKFVREKLRNCKSEAKTQKNVAEAGLQELSLEMLEGVSGGNQANPIPPEWVMKDE